MLAAVNWGASGSAAAKLAQAGWGVLDAQAAGQAITRTYAAIYKIQEGSVAQAGRLRGEAAETRDRGAAADADGPTGAGRAYWPEVARLLRESYRSLKAALA